MRYSMVIMLTLCVVSLAGAHGSLFSSIAPDKETYIGDGAFDGREGGEGFGDAVVIPGLPYADDGATCDNADDITLGCAASNAPDVVYVYTSPATENVTVSLCGSGYDTALAVYDSGLVELYCNDDWCGLQSQIDFVAQSGETYYFVIDGYSTSCGSYILEVTGTTELCDPTCPDGALLEGEPDCYDGYEDLYNAGCGQDPEAWTDICDQEDNRAILCGRSGTFLFDGFNTRDTDWFRCYGNGETMRATCCASFPLQLIFIFGTDCNYLQFDYTTAAAFQEASLSRFVDAGVEVWIWVGASVFEGVPCGSEYLLTMDGIWCEPVAVEETTWGGIRGLFR